MNPNPYDPPKTPIEPPPEVVDRTQRGWLATLIRRYLAEEITAFEFDRQLDSFRDSSDSAVSFVTQAVWYHYDDCDDHLVVLSKAEWDYFQRLLLLLASDRRVHTTRSLHWSSSQVVAFLALLGFASLASHLQWDFRLLLAAIPFGIISIAISWLHRVTGELGPYDPILIPFATFSDLKSTFEAVTFQKARYPSRFQARRIRSPFQDAIARLHFHGTWLILSPIALFVQMFPRMETRTRVMAA